MNLPRLSPAWGLVVLLIGAAPRLEAQDGCTVSPAPFPGRNVLQSVLDAILGGACTRHDLCYRACLAYPFGTWLHKDTCDLALLFDTQSRCGELAVQYAQQLRDAGVDPQDFQTGCDAAMAGVYVALQTSVGWNAYYHDQCDLCSFYYVGLGQCDLAGEVCGVPAAVMCPWLICFPGDADACWSGGGSWDPYSCTCTIGSCGPVDPYLLHDCVSQGGYWDDFGCLCWGTGASPVLLDLAGNGFHLVGVEQGVLFDIDADGTAERMGWTEPGSDDAFLVLDRDFDGTLADGRELFGNFTPQPAGGPRNGFAALAVFDRAETGGNADGKISAADRVFPYLRLWTDSDGDGVSRPAELSTLRDRDVTAIDLAFRESRRRDGHGNEFRFRAKVTFGDYRQSLAYDVYFAQRP